MAAKESAFWEANSARAVELKRQGRSHAEIAAEIGATENAVRFKLREIARAAPEADSNELPQPIQRPAGVEKRLGHVLELNPAPFAVPIPRPAKLRPGKPRRGVVYTDTHSAFHDPQAIAVVQAVVKDVQPDYIIHLGDLLDCYSISRYDKDPARIENLQDEIDWSRSHLHQMSQLAPDAEKWLLEGNHEDRLRKMIWQLPGTASELARLRSFKEAMTWPNLMRLDEIGWGFVPAAGQARRQLVPMLITKHGTVVRKWSGMSAKGEWERYGQSGISGHVHRLGRFYTSDRNGAHTWVEAGCTCDTKPTYMEDPNWQQGCVVIEHSADGGRFEMHLVYIQDGRAMWRGQDYRTAA